MEPSNDEQSYTHEQYVDLTKRTFNCGKFAILRMILLYLLNCFAQRKVYTRQLIIKHKDNDNFNAAEIKDFVISFDYVVNPQGEIAYCPVTENNVEIFNT